MHNSLESHGAVAAWDGEILTVWESTQHVFGVREGLRAALLLPLSRIRVICDYMGGGFGSKGGVGKYSIIASLFAKQLGRPVRCVLTRHEENLAAGNRSATLQKVKLAGKDGRITAVEHISWSNAGQGQVGGESDRADQHAVRHPEPHDEVVPRRHERRLARRVPRARIRRGHVRARRRDRRARPAPGRRSAHAAPPSRRVTEGPAHVEAVLAEAPPRVLHDRRARDRLEQAPRGRDPRLGAASQARHRHGNADLGRRRRAARVRDRPLQRRRHRRSCARGRRTSAPARAPSSRRSAPRSSASSSTASRCASATPRGRTVRSPPAR